MDKKPKVHIFLAHASEDKEQVRELHRKLQHEGYCPWLDEEKLLPGQLWREEIPKAIKGSDFFIACLSEQSVAKKGYVQKEFRLALNYCAERPKEDIYIIPLKLNECHIPDLRQEEYGIALRDYQWLNYYDSDGFTRLLRAIEFQKGKMESGVTTVIEEPNPSNVILSPDFNKVVSDPLPSRVAKSAKTDLSCQVYIQRKSQWHGRANHFDVYCNGHWEVTLSNGENRSFRVAPGTHEFHIEYCEYHEGFGGENGQPSWSSGESEIIKHTFYENTNLFLQCYYSPMWDIRSLREFFGHSRIILEIVKFG